MKTVFALTTALALVGLSGLASAADESAFTLDLTPAGLNSYHVKCQYGSLSYCGVPSLWENTNGMRGLQTGPTQGDDGLPVPPDNPVLS